MPEFSNSFSGVHYNRALTKTELIRAVRFQIAAEYEAVQLYEQLAESTSDSNAKKVLREIANDEKVHAGNFQRLLFYLDPEEQNFYKIGHEEAEELLE